MEKVLGFFAVESFKNSIKEWKTSFTVFYTKYQKYSCGRTQLESYGRTYFHHTEFLVQPEFLSCNSVFINVP